LLGEGYIITDPVTGSGAYKITGGGNGSFIVFLSSPIKNISMFLASLWDEIASFILNNYNDARGVYFDIVVAIVKVFDALENCGSSPGGESLAFLIASFAAVTILVGIAFTLVFNILIGAIIAALVGYVFTQYTDEFEKANCQQ